MDGRDARQMTDRELLISTFEAVQDIKHDLYGNGQPGLIKEHQQLKTIVDERTTSKTTVLGLSGAFTVFLMAASEFIQRRLGQ
jgi:hypothetical protein